MVVGRAVRPEPQLAAVESQALLSPVNDDRRVIDPLEQCLARLMPERLALTGRELDQLQRMSVRIAEIERLDPRRLLVPRGQCLRTLGDQFDAALDQPSISRGHVAHDDRHMAEPVVVAAAVFGHEATPRSPRPQHQTEIAEPQRVAVPLEIENLPIEGRHVGYIAYRQRDAGAVRRLSRIRHERRSLMMSPTRNVLAMMVSVGFTAPLETKKLASSR